MRARINTLFNIQCVTRLFSGYEGFKLVVLALYCEDYPVFFVYCEFTLYDAAATGIKEIDLVRRYIFFVPSLVVLLFFGWRYFSDDEFLAPFPSFPVSLANGDNVITVKLYRHFYFHLCTSLRCGTGDMGEGTHIA